VHPARFPAELPRFFIEFLTEPGDLVLDPFAGSNTTGAVAEQLGRHWLAVEKDETYAKDSELRFHMPERNGKANGQSLLFDLSDT
jgi:site-specific DNA-methyltransferase (cytosine-N4-specific)